jgi:hypothetical protein
MLIHVVEFLQSESDPATHLPLPSEHEPSDLHAELPAHCSEAVGWQRFPTSEQLPSCKHPQDPAQSEARLATQIPSRTKHFPHALQSSERTQSAPVDAAHLFSLTLQAPWSLHQTLDLHSESELATQIPSSLRQRPKAAHSLVATHETVVAGADAGLATSLTHPATTRKRSHTLELIGGPASTLYAPRIKDFQAPSASVLFDVGLIYLGADPLERRSPNMISPS